MDDGLGLDGSIECLGIDQGACFKKMGKMEKLKMEVAQMGGCSARLKVRRNIAHTMGDVRNGVSRRNGSGSCVLLVGSMLARQMERGRE